MSNPNSVSPLERASPLFLIGPPRSGTTALTWILNSHPRILMTNETAVFLQLHENVSKSRIGVRAGILYGKQYHALWAAHLEQNARRLVEGYYAKVAAEQGKTDLAFWGEKHPHLHTTLPFLSRLFPDARYVYVVRDPRDAACSIAEMNGVVFRTALNNWIRFSRLYEKFVEDQGADRVVTVRYEDFVEDYHRVSQRVIGWLGLDMKAEVTTFIDSYKDVDAHRIRAPIKKKINFAAQSRGRWRRELAPDDLAFAIDNVGNFLKKYDYL